MPIEFERLCGRERQVEVEEASDDAAGGRVYDFFDRRVVATYMGEYMGDFIFDTFQPFHFYHDEKVDYFIPRPQIEDKKETDKKKAESPKKSKKKGNFCPKN